MSTLLHDLEIAFRCDRCGVITLRDTAQARFDSYHEHGANLCAKCADTIRCTVREEAYADAMRSRDAFFLLVIGLLAIAAGVAVFVMWRGI